MGLVIKKVTIVLIAVMSAVGLINLNNIVSAVVPGVNERVSLTSLGGQTNGNSNGRASANGKTVVFKTLAANMGGPGIFARDLSTGSVTRVDVSTSGVAADESTYTDVERVSSTGRYITFRSAATNLIDGTTIPASPSRVQIYLRDTLNSTTELITKNASGLMSDGTWNESFGVSSDGRFVLFTSNASNLHPDTTLNVVYMLDRLDNTLSILSRDTEGNVKGVVSGAAMSCDGSLIAFTSGDNLIIGDSHNGQRGIYLLDRRGNSDKLVKITKSINGAAFGVSMSCNGDYIGFASGQAGIDASIPVTMTWNVNRPYVYNRINATYHLASVTSTGQSINDIICSTNSSSSTSCVELSDTGLGVFTANSPSLLGVSGNQVYMRNINTGVTELISRDSAGTAGNGNSQRPMLSFDGRKAFYVSSSTNIIGGDTNNRADVFTSLTGE